MQELSNISEHYGEKALSEEVAKRLDDLVRIYQPELARQKLKK
jgi:hypothetical protein